MTTGHYRRFDLSHSNDKIKTITRLPVWVLSLLLPLGSHIPQLWGCYWGEAKAFKHMHKC